MNKATFLSNHRLKLPGVNKDNVLLSALFVGVNAVPAALLLIFQSPYWLYSLAAWLLFASLLFFYKRKNKTLNHPYLYFMISTVICLLAYLLVYPIDGTVQELLASFDQNLFRLTFNYQLISIIILGFVGLFFGIGQDYTNLKKYKLNLSDKSLRNNVIFVGRVLIVIGAIGLISFLSVRIPASLEFGYGGVLNNQALGDSGDSTDVSVLARSLLIPGLLLMLIAYKNSKKKRAIIVTAICLAALASALVGARINIIIPAIVLVWLYSKEVRPFRVSRIILFLPILILLFAFMVGIREVRDTQDRNASDYITAIAGTLSPGEFMNNITETVKEFGVNYYSLYETIRIIPSEQEYGFGSSYALAIPYLFPPLRNAIGADNNYLHIWLKERNQLEYDPAYTLVAESYYNFGFLGILIISILGYLVYSLFENRYSGFKKSVRNAFIAIAMITILIGAVTHQFQHTLTLLLLTLGLPYVLLIILNNRSIRRRES